MRVCCNARARFCEESRRAVRRWIASGLSNAQCCVVNYARQCQICQKHWDISRLHATTQITEKQETPAAEFALRRVQMISSALQILQYKTVLAVRDIGNTWYNTHWIHDAKSTRKSRNKDQIPHIISHPRAVQRMTWAGLPSLRPHKCSTNELSCPGKHWWPAQSLQSSWLFETLWLYNAVLICKCFKSATSHIV